jgi:hypothetical protein
MGRRKVDHKAGEYISKGDMLYFRGYKPWIPKLGSWAIEIVGRVKSVTPLEVKCIYSNAPTNINVGREIDVNRRQWLLVKKLNKQEAQKWKILDEV